MDDCEIARAYNMALRLPTIPLHELRARRAAMAVYRERHPGATEDDAMQATTRLIAEASRFTRRFVGRASAPSR